VAYTDNIIPTMTSNTAPAGIAVASSEFSASYAAWSAFDGNNVTRWQNAAADTSPWTLEYAFATAKIIARYVIMAGQTPSNTPATWTFEGYDGATWAVLDTQTGVTGWLASERKSFDVPTNRTPYTRYQLNITANDGGTYCALAVLEMAPTAAIFPIIGGGIIRGMGAR